MVDVPCFVGIDGAKAPLDVAVRPSGERWAVPNDTSGVVVIDHGGGHVWLLPLPSIAADCLQPCIFQG